jgi:hypothetical protein
LSAGAGRKAKKPKVLVSILPPEIQAALARGPAAFDSDGEDFDPEVCAGAATFPCMISNEDSHALSVNR